MRLSCHSVIRAGSGQGRVPHLRTTDGMDAGPAVTIVLPTYNRADLLPQALASCLAQTLDDLEVIVVDDGSTDRTADVVEAVCARDPRVRPLRRPHEGLVRALNVGFREARGRYLTWTSDDNLYDRDALAVMVGALEAHPDVGLVYADQRIIDAEGKVLHETSGVEPETLDARARGIGGCFLYRRAVYEAVGEYSEEDAFSEDYEYAMRIGRSFRLLRVPRVLYSYRLHPRSLTTRHGTEAILAMARIRARYATNRRDRNAALAAGLQGAARRELLRGRQGTARRYALRLMGRDPGAGLAMLLRTILPLEIARTLRGLRRRGRQAQ